MDVTGLSADAENSDHPWPSLSVVMPVRDEAEHLERSVNAVLAQDYPGELEVVIALAPSSDGTDDVARALVAAEHRVRLVDNPKALASAGLNEAVKTARGEIIARVDGHSELAPGYLRRAVETLRETGAGTVGGLIVPRGETPFEEAAAAAMRSPVAGANTAFRPGRPPGERDTVALGIFRRELFDRVGGFDESLVRNQDYELNWRIRQHGEAVYFDPRIRSAYRPRGSLRGIARQYHDFGRWKREVVRRHPRSLRVRQLAAPSVVLVNAAALAVALVAWPPVAVVPIAYLLTVTAAAWRVAERARLVPLVALILVVMHVAWGCGFLVGRRLRQRTAQ